MITNERQYQITKKTLDRFKLALQAILKGGDDKPEKLREIERNAVQSQIESFDREINEYERLRSGKEKVLQVKNLEEFPLLLIKARIASNMSQCDLANALNWKEQQVQRYEASQYQTASFKQMLKVATALGLSVDESISAKLNHSDRDIDYLQFPLTQMYGRGWFNSLGISLKEFKANAEEIVGDFVSSNISDPVASAAKVRVRSGSSVDWRALMAWQARVVYLASQMVPQKHFEVGYLNATWFSNLISLSRHNDGPRKARDFLMQSGIALVVEPHLEGTHLDGAVFWPKNSFPIIGVTLRYDRIDSFWFVLFHELAHLKMHLHQEANDSIFDDLDADSNGIESEADHFAGEALVPRKNWDLSLAKFLRTPDSVHLLADELDISVAIVAGKIRHESRNYYILSDLVGSGTVRRLFDENWH
jgi:HTH-type transcriptional regulator / antitoxin HigA